MDRSPLQAADGCRAEASQPVNCADMTFGSPNVGRDARSGWGQRRGLQSRRSGLPSVLASGDECLRVRGDQPPRASTHCLGGRAPHITCTVKRVSFDGRPGAEERGSSGVDIYTEPDGDPDTLANLGPLGPMAGIWEGVRGTDQHPVAEGAGRDAYIERYELQPIDRQTNGPQLLYGLRYHVHIVKPGEVETFHDQVGYWLWEPAARKVTHTLAIPRGQVLLAAGSAAPDATEFEVAAALGSEVYGILSNTFLDTAFRRPDPPLARVRRRPGAGPRRRARAGWASGRRHARACCGRCNAPAVRG